jgi:hypothetical protein
MRILENQRRCFKAYAAVLALVGEILSLIPLVAHLYIQIVTQINARNSVFLLFDPSCAK